MNILAISESLVAGICLLAGIHYLFIAVKKPSEQIYLPFSLLAFCIAGNNLSIIGVYKTFELEQFVIFLKIQTFFSAAIGIVLFWFAAFYTKVIPKTFLIALSVFYFMLAIVNLFEPYGLIYSEIFSLDAKTIWWGETMAQPVGIVSSWPSVFVPVNLIGTGFVFYACFKQYRRGEKNAALVFIISMGIYLFTVFYDILVDQSIIKSPVYISEFGFIALIILMSLKLSSGVLKASEMKEALLESEFRFRNIFENSALGIFQITITGRFIVFNDAMVQILGYKNQAELALVNFNNEIIYNADESRAFIDKLQQNNNFIGFETEINKKDSSRIFVRISSRLTKKREGVEVIEGIIEDITEKKIAEKAMIMAKEKAENSDRLKSEFLAQMSHEIRTPINAVLSFASLIREEADGKFDTDMMESFGIIDRAGRRIIRTIDLLLDMSQIQTNTYETNFSRFNLYDKVIYPLFAEYRPAAKHKNLDISVIKKTEEVMIWADEYTVFQIFNNLIDNAVKYTNEGSIRIYIDKGENSLQVNIADTGIGISEQYLPSLFEAFTQEETGYTRKYEGNGLGLALVKKYCEINEINVKVTSAKNKGSEFTLTFKK